MRWDGAGDATEEADRQIVPELVDEQESNQLSRGDFRESLGGTDGTREYLWRERKAGQVQPRKGSGVEIPR